MSYVKIDKELIKYLNHDNYNYLTESIFQIKDLSPIEKDVYWSLLDQTVYTALEKGTNFDNDDNIYMKIDVDSLKAILEVQTNEQASKVLLHFVNKHVITTKVEFSTLRYENSIIFERLYLLIPQDIYDRITNKPILYPKTEEKFYY